MGTLVVGLTTLYASTDEDTPVMFEKMEEPETTDHSKDRVWKAPDYTQQENALGYTKEAFAIPKGLESKVSFWIDIFTKYNTDQGVIHDSRYEHLVYEFVDFTSIMKNENLSLRQKRRARKKLVKSLKKEIKQRMDRLSKVKDPVSLKGKDLQYWKMFESVDEKNKFRKAKHRKRLRFQLGQSDRFIQGIYFSGKYLKQMEGIFRERGLPIELTRLPFVESSFNYKARSKVGASGIWQFMRYTGRQYMKINWSVDERNDPISSTVAAAKMMKFNYEMLQSWPLAVTGYNRGANGVRRLVKKYKTRNLVELADVRRGRFGFASANFYASFLAALEVERRADVYFGKNLKWMDAFSGKKIKLSKNIKHTTLLKWFDGNLTQAKDFNPHVRRNVWKGWRVIRRRNFIRVPEDKYEIALNDLKNIKNESPARMTGKTYKIARGDTLSDIAQQFGISVRSLIRANEIDNPRRIRAGQKLVIPQK